VPSRTYCKRCLRRSETTAGKRLNMRQPMGISRGGSNADKDRRTRCHGELDRKECEKPRTRGRKSQRETVQEEAVESLRGHLLREELDGERISSEQMMRETTGYVGHKEGSGMRGFCGRLLRAPLEREASRGKRTAREDETSKQEDPSNA